MTLHRKGFTTKFSICIQKREKKDAFRGKNGIVTGKKYGIRWFLSVYLNEQLLHLSSATRSLHISFLMCAYQWVHGFCLVWENFVLKKSGHIARLNDKLSSIPSHPVVIHDLSFRLCSFFSVSLVFVYYWSIPEVRSLPNTYTMILDMRFKLK